MTDPRDFPGAAFDRYLDPPNEPAHYRECPQHEDSCLSDGDCICERLREYDESEAAEARLDMEREG